MIESPEVYAENQRHAVFAALVANAIAAHGGDPSDSVMKWIIQTADRHADQFERCLRAPKP